MNWMTVVKTKIGTINLIVIFKFYKIYHFVGVVLECEFDLKDSFFKGLFYN
ncbi:hypothetical protein LEP1GSC059_1765 [Leptospira noguchii serovar Panama str. CZ214]|uniref:Uncharacterized protein n=1 Tax=Leptospira noguchii serovar Panama str. CZ214 TaxID=1001595 RepID=T0GR56_9LEPT|nr:hypothetical protein LEP1GSC059_1765 [Leptospira noguchii serovar Panama str. CZ214]